MPMSDVPETAVKIYADKWVATVFSSHHPDENGFYHVYCTTVGDSFLDAVNAAIHVLQTFTWGRTCFVRVEPEAVSEIDFDTKITHHRGITRFSYKLEKGIRHYPEADADVKIPFLSEASHV